MIFRGRARFCWTRHGARARCGASRPCSCCSAAPGRRAGCCPAAGRPLAAAAQGLGSTLALHRTLAPAMALQAAGRPLAAAARAPSRTGLAIARTLTRALAEVAAPAASWMGEGSGTAGRRGALKGAGAAGAPAAAAATAPAAAPATRARAARGGASGARELCARSCLPGR
jgi:hypothetical protein